MVLASSADEPEFKALRAALDAEDAIDAATFAGDVESSKPAPDLVEAALAKAGVPAGEAVFVGDTAWDVQACRKAGVPCIGLLSGGISRDELATAGAVETYPAPADLLAAFGVSLLGGGALCRDTRSWFIFHRPRLPDASCDLAGRYPGPGEAAEAGIVPSCQQGMERPSAWLGLV